MQPTNKEAQIILAVQAHQNEPNLTVKSAAKIYSVPRTTLRRRLNGTPSRPDTMPNLRNLTAFKEEKLVDGVEEMANRLLDDRNASPVGKRWAPNFVKRQPRLRTRFFRKCDYKRAQCEDPDAIHAWFRRVANTTAKYGIVGSDIYNFDETGFMMGQITNAMVVTSAERRSNTKMAQPGNREWATVIEAINSQGYSVPPYIIVAGQHHLSTRYTESGLPRDWRGLDGVQHFDRHTKPRSKGPLLRPKSGW
ncbi:tranpsosase [Colletotrichum incanum]|nr:tranpsosase [Colletotrichum incanum]